MGISEAAELSAFRVKLGTLRTGSVAASTGADSSGVVAVNEAAPLVLAAGGGGGEELRGDAAADLRPAPAAVRLIGAALRTVARTARFAALVENKRISGLTSGKLRQQQVFSQIALSRQLENVPPTLPFRFALLI